MTAALPPNMAAAVARALAASRAGYVEEIEADNFAGGGGASEGIRRRTGRDVAIAVNHDPDALAMHEVNHPNAEHYCEDVFAVDPLKVTRGRPVGLAWFSPDCRHFSRAKGGKPVDKRVRGLAWVAVKWGKLVRPRIIGMENVSEILTWGPLLEDNTPDPDRKGITFKRFITSLRNLGYEVDWRELIAADYGTPTIRKRLFIIARCDGQPIVFPQPTYSKNGEVMDTLPWRTAAEIIDWSRPCPSLFMTKKVGKVLGVKRPLARATLTRVATGVRRFVLESADPFIVPMEYAQTMRAGDGERTAAVQGELFQNAGPDGLVVPALSEALGAVPSSGMKQAQVAAFLAKHYWRVAGHAADSPTPTVGPKDHHALATARLELKKPFGRDQQHQEVRAFLMKYYGQGGQHSDLHEPVHTIPTKARMGLVTVSGYDNNLTDIGMRMLTAAELYRAQGFGPHYIHTHTARGKLLSEAAQIRMVGNSAPPDVVEAIVRLNYTPQRYFESDIAIAAAA